ncbi:hypothetical protein PFY10_12485 [Chryseobacterium daecheongense]|nr:hypothetical protein PFY10_12485 [Chryseobacterium daecheongense]
MNKRVIVLIVGFLVLGFLLSFLFYPPKEFYKGLKMSYASVFFPFAYAIYKTVRSNKNTEG